MQYYLFHIKSAGDSVVEISRYTEISDLHDLNHLSNCFSKCAQNLPDVFSTKKQSIYTVS